MRILILHQRVDADAAPDERDVLVQVEAVARALEGRGHETIPFPCDLDLSALDRALSDLGPDVTFNLVESLGGSGALQHLVPSVLELRGRAFTGNSADALRFTTNKVLSKRWMEGAGIPVPMDHRSWSGPCIVKPVWEDASIGIDAGSVVATSDEARRLLAEKKGDWFAEAYIPGREINLGLIDGPSGPIVLPPAEVRFAGDWADRPRIVGYAAKWEPGSFEYQHSERTLDLSPDDPDLAGLAPLALRVWSAFDLAGYARVDLRIAEDGAPYVLEVNANPCLSPDAGFAAGLEKAGIPYDAAMDRIVEAGVRRWKR
jgi:D-alanine-D-alanine ligase